MMYRSREVNMTYVKTALLLLITVMGAGTSLGLVAMSDFMVAGAIALLAVPLATPWFH